MVKHNLVLAIIFLLNACGQKSTQNTDSETNEDLTSDTVIEQAIDTVPEIDLSDIQSYYGGSWMQRNANNPVFKSRKVDEMVIQKAKPNPSEEDAMDFAHDYFNQQELEQLTVTELIYYCFAYQTSYSQICAADDYYDSTNTLKIQGYMPTDYSGNSMSELQWKNIEKRKDSVVIVLSKFIEEYPDQIENDYLRLFLRLNTAKPIPALIKTASDKNITNYTCLLQLMKRNEYKPLLESSIGLELYNQDEYRYGSRVEATAENKKAVIDLAKKFYKEFKEKK